VLRSHSLATSTWGWRSSPTTSATSSSSPLRSKKTFDPCSANPTTILRSVTSIAVLKLDASSMSHKRSSRDDRSRADDRNGRPQVIPPPNHLTSPPPASYAAAPVDASKQLALPVDGSFSCADGGCAGGCFGGLFVAATSSPDISSRPQSPPPLSPSSSYHPMSVSDDRMNL
jgi:hypothetical protein